MDAYAEHKLIVGTYPALLLMRSIEAKRAGLIRAVDLRCLRLP